MYKQCLNSQHNHLPASESLFKEEKKLKTKEKITEFLHYLTFSYAERFKVANISSTDTVACLDWRVESDWLA